jgi:hypothetical protein
LFFNFFLKLFSYFFYSFSFFWIFVFYLICFLKLYFYFYFLVLFFIRIYKNIFILLKKKLKLFLLVLIRVMWQYSSVVLTYIGARGALPLQAPKFFPNFFLKKIINFIPNFYFYFSFALQFFFSIWPHPIFKKLGLPLDESIVSNDIHYPIIFHPLSLSGMISHKKINFHAPIVP